MTRLSYWSGHAILLQPEKNYDWGNVHGKIFTEVFGLYNDYNQSKCSMSKPVDFPANDDWHWLTFSSYGRGALVLEGVAILKQAPFWGVNFSNEIKFR